jgi:ubiquinone biosynthesis protein COQ4
MTEFGQARGDVMSMIAEKGSDLTLTPKARKRIQPIVAWQAIRALIADKEDTGQVFKVIRALEGNADDRMFTKFRAMATGQAILKEKRNLLDLLSDRDGLAGYAPGTLGHRYYQFMTVENLTADGLVAASKVVERDVRDEDRERFGNRMRDSHDLWHCATGYGRDGLGELSLLAFTYAQTRNRGLGAIVFFGALDSSKKFPSVGIWSAVREGYRLGKKAAWLPAADWENLLARPLSEVRSVLEIGELKLYRETLARVAAIDAAAANGAAAEKMKLAA